MKFNWYKKDVLCTEIDVDYEKKTVNIVNHTDRFLDRAFGKNENPTLEDFKDFLESRCFPRTVGDLKWHLEALDLQYYDPLAIVEKTKGVLEGDNFSLDIIEDDEVER